MESATIPAQQGTTASQTPILKTLALGAVAVVAFYFYSRTHFHT